MTDSPLIVKSKEFALDIIKVCNYIKQTKKESVLTNQLIRSGTSVGANIREAFYAHGRADFIAKLQIALKAKLIKVGGFMKNVENQNLIPIARLGYRPYTSDFPQQSLQSYAKAYEKKHHIFLCDVRLTADGKTVCCHDDDISRVGAKIGGKPAENVFISQTDSADLLRYDFSESKGNIRPLPILLLEDFLRFCSEYPDVTPCLELKVDIAEKADYIIGLVKKYGYEDNIMFVCGEGNARIMAKAFPSCVIGDWVYAATDSIIERMASYGVKTFVYVGKEGKQPESINEKTYAKAKALGVDLGYTYISNRERELFDNLKEMGIFKYCKYVGLDETEWLEE